jgi:hypothetical protein
MEAVLKHGGGVEAWMAHRSKDGTPRHGRRTEAWMAHRSMEAWRYSSVFFFFFCPFLLSLSLSLSPRTFLFLYFTSQRMDE